MTKWAQEQINAGARMCVQCCSCTHGRSARAPDVVQAYGQCHEPQYEFNVLNGNLVKEKAKLNYGEALSNLPDDKILCRLYDWNCEWLSRPNIAISEMASTLKENWTNIMAYRGTVFTEEFVDDLRRFVDPIVDPLRRVDNKDKLDMDPPNAEDVLKIVKAINNEPWVEDLFMDAFNVVGPVMMMSIHVLVINCLMHNPDVFAEKSVRAQSTEKFKGDPSFKNMMRYLIDQILRNAARSIFICLCGSKTSQQQQPIVFTLPYPGEMLMTHLPLHQSRNLTNPAYLYVPHQTPSSLSGTADIPWSFSTLKTTQSATSELMLPPCWDRYTAGRMCNWQTERLFYLNT